MASWTVRPFAKTWDQYWRRWWAACTRGELEELEVEVEGEVLDDEGVVELEVADVVGVEDEVVEEIDGGSGHTLVRPTFRLARFHAKLSACNLPSLWFFVLHQDPALGEVLHDRWRCSRP